MAKEHPQIIDINSQLKLLNDVENLSDYTDLYHLLFSDPPDCLWMRLLKNSVKNKPPKPFIQLLSLNAILFAEHGFFSLEGQELRHLRRGYQRPMFHPYHQLAMTDYACRINKLSHPIKEEWFKLLKDSSDFNPNAVWGVMMPIQNGRLAQVESDPKKIKELVEFRSGDKRPILLPDIRLINRLSGIDFLSEMADTIDKRRFRELVYPRTIRVFTDILDPEFFYGLSKRERFIKNVRKMVKSKS